MRSRVLELLCVRCGTSQPLVNWKIYDCLHWLVSCPGYQSEHFMLKEQHRMPGIPVANKCRSGCVVLLKKLWHLISIWSFWMLLDYIWKISVQDCLYMYNEQSHLLIVYIQCFSRRYALSFQTHRELIVVTTKSSSWWMHAEQMMLLILWCFLNTAEHQVNSLQCSMDRWEKKQQSTMGSI